MVGMAIISDIIRKVQDQIETICPELLDSAGDRAGILLAISGGTDSMALFDVFVRLAAANNWRLLVGHLNHCLRGLESDRDEQYVIEQCHKSQIACQSRKADIAALAAAEGISVEAAARQVRYDFLGELCREYQLKYLATGHHADDNSETILHRIIRGTGIGGLAGIKPRRRLDNDRGREIIVFRPLLEVRRRELEEYIAAAGLSPCHDRSNDSLDYTRNRLRNQLIPGLRNEYNPALDRALANLGQLAADAAETLSEQAQADMEAACARLEAGLCIIPLGYLSELSAGRIRNLLRWSLERINAPLAAVGYRQIEDIRRECHNSGSRLLLDLPGDFRAEIADGKLIIAGNIVGLAGGEPVRLLLPGVTAAGELVELVELAALSGVETALVELADFDLEQFRQNKPANQELIDADKVAGELFITALPTGERYQPLGMSGSQTSGDIMTNFKVPRYLRGRIAAICDDAGIVCIPGHRIADRLKVDTGSRRGILLSFSRD